MKLFAAAAGIASMLALAGCDRAPQTPGKQSESQSPVTIATDKQFVVYDFWAPWCGPCREYTPVFEKLQAKYSRDNVSFKRINVDEDSKTANRFGIRSIPTVVVTANDREIGRAEGGMREAQLAKLLK
jgi:thioredoxin